MVHTKTSEFLKLCTEAEKLALIFIEDFSSMNTEQLKGYSKTHKELQNNISLLADQIEPESLQTQIEKDEFEQSCSILERILQHNSKITGIVSNSQALLTKEMHSIKAGRTALSGYNQAYNKIDSTRKTQGRLINKSG